MTIQDANPSFNGWGPSAPPLNNPAILSIHDLWKIFDSLNQIEFKTEEGKEL